MANSSRGDIECSGLMPDRNGSRRNSVRDDVGIDGFRWEARQERPEASTRMAFFLSWWMGLRFIPKKRKSVARDGAGGFLPPTHETTLYAQYHAEICPRNTASTGPFFTDGERFDKMNNASVASLRARSASPWNAVGHPRNRHSSPEKHAGTGGFPAYKAGR